MPESVERYNDDVAVNDSESGWDIIDLLTSLRFDYSVEGEKNYKVKGVAGIQEAVGTDLTFCSWDGEQAVNAIARSNAGIIMCKKQLKGLAVPKKGAALIFLDNPRLSFVSVASELQKAIDANRRDDRSFATLTAIIARSAKVGINCSIGNHVVIGENCIVGDNTRIHDRVTLSQNCTLGKNCIIQSGVTLGEDGFAYERYETTEPVKFPHFRGVIIEDNVEICANTNIARGSLTDTVIGEGTKIDSMVHIAHNVRVGKNCLLTAGTIIGGSASIGDSCWTGLNCTIKDHVKLGNNVLVGAGACVIHDVPDGDIVAGIPAKSIKHKVSTHDTFLMAGQNNSVGKVID